MPLCSLADSSFVNSKSGMNIKSKVSKLGAENSFIPKGAKSYGIIPTLYFDHNWKFNNCITFGQMICQLFSTATISVRTKLGILYTEKVKDKKLILMAIKRY